MSSICPDCGQAVDIDPLVPCGAGVVVTRPIHSGGVECRDGRGTVITHDAGTVCEICAPLAGEGGGE